MDDDWTPPETWINIFDLNGGSTSIEYTEQLETQLQNVIQTPPNERHHMLELPFVEQDGTVYCLHEAHLVSFFVSTPQQRHRTRLHDDMRKREQKAHKAVHGSFDDE